MNSTLTFFVWLLLHMSRLLVDRKGFALDFFLNKSISLLIVVVVSLRLIFSIVVSLTLILEVVWNEAITPDILVFLILLNVAKVVNQLIDLSLVSLLFLS